jgi:hypothetical protein
LAVKDGPSKPDLARDLLDLVAEHFPDRDIHAVGDSAYGCGAFAGLGDGMTMTTRAKTNAAFYQLAPPRTGKRGRPALKGERIGTPTQIAATAVWKTVTVTRYGTTNTVKPQPKKSWTSSKPGHKQPHNRESRAVMVSQKFISRPP